jgi:hypothetical protein
MFSYFGSKSKIVNYYPKPRFDTIVEPFAGSARYSLKYLHKNVILIEKCKKICDIWNFLISASKQDILSLPDTVPGGPAIKTGYAPADDFVFLCSSRGNASIYNYTKYGKFNSWNKYKLKVAELVPQIKHWKIYNNNYDFIHIDNATYFIDPPYQKLGHRYEEKFNEYSSLISYINSLKGQIIVCENEDQTWMPKCQPVKRMTGNKHCKLEVMWYKEV